jgi:hypothetical protein
MRQVPNLDYIHPKKAPILFKSITMLLTAFVMLFAVLSNVQAAEANKQKFGNITVIKVQGTHYEMGVQYGSALQTEMQQALLLLENYYVRDHGVPYQRLLNQADAFYARFPYSYQVFMQGIAEGAGMNLDDVKILNAMETMNELLAREGGHCAFIALAPQQSATHATLIGRNYDYSAPFDQIAKYLTVTILQEDNTVPTAIIAMPGQIYCPSCVNAAGLFMEMNNGMPSGGSFINKNRQTLLINMLLALQNSTSLFQVETQLNAIQADYSLIVNTADANHVKSYEFSSTLGMKEMLPLPEMTFVSTNFYLNPAWKNIPPPSDATTWLGVTRRNNLLALADATPQLNITQFQTLMDKHILSGGAVWAPTIYQLIYDSSTQNLYVKINSAANTWSKIPLAQLFSATEEGSSNAK